MASQPSCGLLAGPSIRLQIKPISTDGQSAGSAIRTRCMQLTGQGVADAIIGSITCCGPDINTDVDKVLEVRVKELDKLGR